MTTPRPSYRFLSGIPSMSAIALVCLTGGCAALSPATGNKSSAGMEVTSSAFAENGPIASKHAGIGDCGGRNVSLPVSWNNLPANAKSVAVLLWDPDGAGGLGVSHWVAYNIAAERGQLKSGDAQAGADFSMGPNVSGAAAYRGMCPPAGDQPHHYTLTVVASELPPGALPPGLARDALLAALKGHALGGQSVVGRYGR